MSLVQCSTGSSKNAGHPILHLILLVQFRINRNQTPNLLNLSLVIGMKWKNGMWDIPEEVPDSCLVFFSSLQNRVGCERTPGYPGSSEGKYPAVNEVF